MVHAAQPGKGAHRLDRRAVGGTRYADGRPPARPVASLGRFGAQGVSSCEPPAAMDRVAHVYAVVPQGTTVAA